MSSANYLNTNSNSNGKTVASEGSRVNIEGYNLPVSQSITLNSDLKHEVLVIPSTSAPAFGGFHSIHIREKNIVLHNLSLQLVLSFTCHRYVARGLFRTGFLLLYKIGSFMWWYRDRYNL